MRQKVALAGALVHDPRLIILDEPLTGLDAGSARQVKNVLRERVRAGGTVIMTTHILEVAERMADRIGVIAHGRLIAEGTLDELRRQAGKQSKRRRRMRRQCRAICGASLEDTFLALSPSAALHGRSAREAASSCAHEPAGTAVWFARHELRLAWRDWRRHDDRPAGASALPQRRHRLRRLRRLHARRRLFDGRRLSPTPSSTSDC